MSGNSPNMIGISLLISQMPGRQGRSEHHEHRPTIEQKVRDCIERIDNGCGTEVDFLTLKKLKAAIQSKPKLTPRMKNILDMVEPVIRKFGYYF